MADHELTKQELYAPWGTAIQRPSEEEFGELDRVLRAKLQREQEEWKARTKGILEDLKKG